MRNFYNDPKQGNTTEKIDLKTNGCHVLKSSNILYAHTQMVEPALPSTHGFKAKKWKVRPPMNLKAKVVMSKD